VKLPGSEGSVVVLLPPLPSVPTTSPVRACVRGDEVGFGVVAIALGDALDSEHGDGGEDPEGDDHDEEFKECGSFVSSSLLFRALGV
jgi:hypothetical protein